MEDSRLKQNINFRIFNIPMNAVTGYSGLMHYDENVNLTRATITENTHVKMNILYFIKTSQRVKRERSLELL